MLLTAANKPRPWIRRLLGVGLIFAYLLKLLFGTLPGLFLISCAIYFALPLVCGVHPWSPERLFLWFDELDSGAKVGLASSLITVLGFFVAVQTTMHSWQRQTAASMRMAAADSIDRVVTEVNRIILQIHVFAEAVGREVGRVHAEGISPSAAAMLTPLCQDVSTFRENRKRLLELEQEVLALPARYSVLLLPLSGVSASLMVVADHVRQVTERVWVTTPGVGPEHPDHRRRFVDSIDPAKYIELSQACKAAHGAIARIHGGLRGTLLSPVIELNLVSFFRITRAMFQRRED